MNIYLKNSFGQIGKFFYLIYEPEQFGATRPSLLKDLWMVIVNFFAIILLIIFCIIGLFGLTLGKICNILFLEDDLDI